MKLAIEGMEQILTFTEGYALELVIENKKMFFETVAGVIAQIDGDASNKLTLSINEKTVEMSRYADVTIQFAPFELNRKSLLTKLCNALEQQANSPLHYTQTGKLMESLAFFVDTIAEDFPFEVDCQKIAIGPILRAISPQVADTDKKTTERVLDYMEMVRELDKDRLFIMVNMRTYFSDEEMSSFLKSACMHDFKILLVESFSYPHLKDTIRYTVDKDLCEF